MDRPSPDSPHPTSQDPVRPLEDDATVEVHSSGADAPTLAGVPAAPAARPLPASIGRYRIVGRLGEGGMGIVFEAEQEHPRRRVALKVIRGGTFVDEQQVRMFQREADTLARLKHPNIGAIYEAGRTDAGEHFFAMELVRGRMLDDYIRSRPGPLDDAEVRFRLRLFQSICAAVNYAHQRGVIHRDLKPSNIVVADADAGADAVSSPGASTLPEVKILDFGLARITGADVEAATAMSEVGVIKGTLPYMSPEQARGNPDEIDLRSDVYALGVILYEMLTGARPYETQKTSIMEAVRIICEQPPLSLRQAWRGSRAPDADLQTITGKALEKEPERRYASAAALGEDVGLYLESRPILARAPSSMYQLSRFARRNRALVAGVAATLVALVAGIVVSTTFGIREGQQRRAAERAQKDTEAVANFQEHMLGDIDAQKMGRGLEDDLASRLESGLREGGAPPAQVAAALGSFRAHMSGINTTDAALRVIDKNILERAVSTATAQFAAQPKLHAQLLSSIGYTYLKLGILDKAEPQLLHARALYDSLFGRGSDPSLVTQRELAVVYMQQGRVEQAEPLYLSALAGLSRRHGVRHNDVLATMNDLGTLYTDMGRFGEAESLFAIAVPAQRALAGDSARFTLTVLSNYAWALTQDGKYPKAESLATRALALRRAVLGNDDSETLTSVNNLGVLYVRMGRLDAAEPLYLEDYRGSLRALGEEHPDMLPTMTNLGRLYSARRKFVEAEKILARAVLLSKRKMPPGFMGTGITLLAHGEALLGLGRFREAEPELLEGQAILLRNFGEHDGGVQRAIGLLVSAYEGLGRKGEAAAWRQKLDPQE